MTNASYGEVQYNLTIGEKLIFNLGGILDNFANGWIRVVGNLIVDGDLNISGNLNVSKNLNVVGNISADDKVLEKDVPLIPRGAIIPFYLASCPAGWVLADGTSGTPDLRGIFIRGAGTNSIINYANGTDMSSTYGEYQNDSIQSHYHSASGGAFATITGVAVENSNFQSGTNANGWQFGYSGISVIDSTTAGNSTGIPRTGAETRPASYALIYCMKN
jgi:hypothetical protein